MGARTRLAVCSAGSVALFLWGCASGVGGLDPAVLGGLAVAALALESFPLQLPKAGLLSPSSGIYLSCALLVKGGWGAGVFLMALGLSWRSFRAGRGDVELRLAEALGDLFPGLAALALHGQWGHLPHAWALTLLFYLPLALRFPSWLMGQLGEAHARARVRSAPFLGGAALVAPLLASALPDPRTLLLLPLLILLRQAMALAVQTSASTDQQLLAVRLEKREKAVDDLDRELERVRRGLLAESGQKQTLEKTARVLGSSNDPQKTLEQLLEVCHSLAPSRSIVIFLSQEGRLLPAAFRSPHQERLEGAALLQLQEPLVERAWRENRCLLTEQHASVPRLLENEPYVAVYPLHGFGVLYLGRQRHRFTEDEQAKLNTAASQATLALGQALQSASREQRLAWVSQEHRALQRWVFRLRRLLQGANSAAATLEPSEAVKNLTQAATDLIPFEVLMLVSLESDQRPELLSCNVEPPIAYARVRPLVEAVTSSGKPLLLDQFANTRFQPPGLGLESVLAVPLMAGGKTQGALLLFGAERGQFDREQQDLLELLAFQTAAALAKLQLSQQVLEASKLAAVGQMAAGVAHELNNPLGAVQLNMDAAVEMLEFSPGKVEERLQRGTQALDRARNIVAALLYYSRRRPLDEPEEVELNAVVTRTLETLDVMLKGLTIEVELSAGELRCQGRPTELEQVLTNLVLNARDALAEQEARTVRIRTGQDQNSVWLEVADNGPGLTPEAVARATEPFFTTKPPGSGTGLGLSICERIASHHGGSLSHRSSDLGGAAFVLSLPGEL